jgi:hypothetical protein
LLGHEKFALRRQSIEGYSCLHGTIATSGPLLRLAAGVSAIRVCGRESETAGLNPQLTVPAHPRHDLPAVMFLLLVMTVWWSRCLNKSRR